jgi:hypothetical protein
MPVGAAAITLIAVVTLFGWLLHDRSASRLPATGRSAPGDPTESIDNARHALATGEFQRALAYLDAARASGGDKPTALSAEQQRNLAQLHRQASLLANLLSESLQDILLRAPSIPEHEWQAQFARLYRDKTILFDAEVRRDGEQLSLDYFLQAEDKPVRIELAKLELFTKLLAHDTLPQGQGQRLFFGARLASISREAGGGWVIRFQPDSGALMTDVGAAVACCPLPLDKEQQETLRRQAEWVKEWP